MSSKRPQEETLGRRLAVASKTSKASSTTPAGSKHENAGSEKAASTQEVSKSSATSRGKKDLSDEEDDKYDSEEDDDDDIDEDERQNTFRFAKLSERLQRVKSMVDVVHQVRRDGAHATATASSTSEEELVSATPSFLEELTNLKELDNTMHFRR